MPLSTTPDELLRVVVAGGGPVGLTFSINLVMMMGKHVHISIYEGRWFVDDQEQIRWQDERQGKSRRDQVVTLQDHVIEQMPDYVQKGLFRRIDERVWPTSRNIPIREVEDRLFELIQPFVQAGQIELIPENLHEQSACLIDGNFDVLVGTDGANSFVRRYCNIQMISEGVEYACGVAYDVPSTVAVNEEPLHQALNCILTVCQTRYLVNSSTSRRGYLNIRLIKSEYDELRERLQEIVGKSEPIDLSDYDKCPNSPVWSIIRQGLQFFHIPSKYVYRVVPIEINVRHASIVVRELRFELPPENPTKETPLEKKKYKTMLAFLAGDAAMNVHFWPGRGMNSGMKAAIALGRNILRVCTKDKTIHLQKPLRFLDFLDYEAFMARLRAREQQGRSLRVLVNPIDPYIEASYSYAHLPHCYARYTRELVKKLQETRDRLVNRPEWPHKNRQITDDELRSASHRISHHAVAQLSLTNPWPTREMSGVEVLVEAMFPFDRRDYIAVPIASATRVLFQRSTTQMMPQHLIILCITGKHRSDRMNRLIHAIHNAPEFSRSTAGAGLKHQFRVFQSLDQVNEWIAKNKTLATQTNTMVKVVTVWRINARETAINAIRTVRSVLPRTPFLIFSHEHSEIRLALEFPHVMATDLDFEVKEFVGMNRDTQWHDGYEVAHEKHDKPKVREASVGDGSSPPIESGPDHKTPLRSALCSSASVPVVKSLPINSPLLIWIDREDNDVKTVGILRTRHPNLELKFVVDYQAMVRYLNGAPKDIAQRSKVLFICRGNYRDEGKTFLDIIRFLEDSQLPCRSLLVYTRDRTQLMKSVKNVPEGILIVDRREELLSFVTLKLLLDTPAVRFASVSDE